MSDVFISYSRRDKAFVRALCHALQQHGHHLWVDWEGIRSSLPWREEIASGIRQATRLVYIVSPDAITSEYCNWEIDQALEHQKKLIPVVCREVSSRELRPEIGKLQVISFCGEDDFVTALDKLEGAISADLDYDRMFAKLAQQAQEWVSRDRSDGWLRGADLDEAEIWLANSTGKTPAPNPIQQEYILASRQERQQELERWQSLYKTSEQRRISAEHSEINAFCKSSEAYFALDRPLDALIEALQAGSRLQQNDWPSQDLPLKTQVITVLLQALYWVRERNRLEGHIGTVRSVALSPNGQLIATAGRDKTVKLWRRNGECIATLIGHQDMVRSVAFSPGGDRLVSASWDGTLRLWSTAGELIAVLEGHRDRVNQAQFHPQGDWIASVGRDHNVLLWDRTGQFLKELANAGTQLECLAWSPDGKSITAGGGDGRIRRWNLDGVLHQVLPGHKQSINTLCFDPTGQLLATGDTTGLIKLWKEDGTYLRDFVGHDDEIKGLLLSQDQQVLVSASGDQTARVWHINGQHRLTLTGHNGPVLGLAADPTAQTLLTAGADGIVKIWQWASSRVIGCSINPTSTKSLAFLPNGESIAVIGANHQVQFWGRSGQKLSEFQTPLSNSGRRDWATRLVISSDGRYVATAAAGDTGQVSLWTIAGREIKTWDAHKEPIRHLTFSPDGQNLATIAHNDQKTKVWTLRGECIQTLSNNNIYGYVVQFSPDGKLLAFGGRAHTVQLWCNGQQIQTLTGHEDIVHDLAFSPDGQLVLSASDDRTARIWALDGTLVATLTGHTNGVYSIAINPAGTLIATGSRDGTFKLWTMAGELLTTQKADSDQVTAVAFSPDGEILATLGTSGHLLLWQLEQFDEDLLNRLVSQGMDWCRDYLQTNPVGQGYNL
jgi:WD40 repeat protein